jgi:L-glyceraldehyde reductase
MYNQAFGNNMLNIPLLITRPEVKEVAEAVAKRTGQDVTPAHVILAWSQVGGHSVIPKSVTPSRIRDNFKEVELTAEEVAKVSALGNDRKRYNTPYTASMCSFIYVSQSIFVDELLTGLPYRQASLEH